MRQRNNKREWNVILQTNKKKQNKKQIKIEYAVLHVAVA